MKHFVADAAKGAREKTVVVSSSTKVLDIIAKMRQHDAASFVRLDGSTKQDLRAGLVDRFQQDPNISVFLLSTKAGGDHECYVSTTSTSTHQKQHQPT
jgi:SWI/SNF-related matrix-associated actin-dependent regulator 1 of chromatin subfamily A